MRSYPWLLLVSVIASSAAGQSPVHVDAQIGTPGNGSTWALAMKDLQAAITAVPPGGQIWVKKGVVSAGSGSAGNSNAVYEIAKDVSIYGGFEGDEEFLSQRPCLGGGEGGISELPDFLPPNALNRIMYVGAAQGSLTVKIDRFRMVQAGLNQSPQTWKIGAGLYVANDGAEVDLDVSWCQFDQNHGAFVPGSGGGGGAIYIDGAHDVGVKWSIFRNNIVDFGAHGGGIHADGADSLLVHNCVFDNGNLADRGGAVYANDTTPVQLVNCLMHSNQTDSEGIVYLAGTSMMGAVINCTIVSNSFVPSGRVLFAENRGCSLSTSNSIVAIGAGQSVSNQPIACLSYSNLEGTSGAGLGNIDFPMQLLPTGTHFQNIFNNNFTPVGGTPVIDSGNSDVVPADALDLDGDLDVIEAIPLDLHGRPRFINDPAAVDAGTWSLPPVDMGAFENPALQQDPPVPPCQNLLI